MMWIAPSRCAQYARAFLDAVLHLEGETAVARNIAACRTFLETWRSSPELQRALLSPAIPAAQRRAVIASLCSRQQITTPTRNLLFILSDRYLLHNYPPIVDRIEQDNELRQGIERACITSSRELGEDERTRLQTEIEQHRNTRVRLICQVDPTVLGGIRMQIGSTVWDDTVRGRLDTLLKVLSEPVTPGVESPERRAVKPGIAVAAFQHE